MKFLSSYGFIVYALKKPVQFIVADSDFAITHKEDNDTPVQSQSERDKTVAGNEGGSVRPTVGVELPWCQFAADRLATSHSISGCRGQIEMLLSYSAKRKAVIRTEILFILSRP